MPASRRSLMLSLPPLWLIGVCLFLPTVRGCEKMESPASLIWGSPPFFVALLAPFIVAQLIALVVVVALARGRVTPLATRMVAALVALTGSSAVTLAVVGFGRRSQLAEQAWSVAAGCAFVAGALVMVRARKLEPWTRLACFVAAYTIFTLPVATLLVRILVDEGFHKEGYGAYLFYGAFATLAVVHLGTLRAPRDLVARSTA